MPRGFPKGYYTHSEATRLKISQALRGRPRPHLSAEQRAKLSAALKGKAGKYVRTSEIRKKNSAGLLGRSIPKDVAEKIGRSLSLVLKGKSRPAIRGEKNPNWRGGISDERNRYHVSAEHKQWRDVVFQRDNYTCQECGKRGGNIHAHHKKSFCLFPELRTAFDNGQTLCESCHKKTASWGRPFNKLAAHEGVK